jgi:hypothetical protein
MFVKAKPLNLSVSAVLLYRSAHNSLFPHLNEVMSDSWPHDTGKGAGIAAAAAVGQMIVSVVSLGQRTAVEQ